MTFLGRKTVSLLILSIAMPVLANEPTGLTYGAADQPPETESRIDPGDSSESFLGALKLDVRLKACLGGNKRRSVRCLSKFGYFKEDPDDAPNEGLCPTNIPKPACYPARFNSQTCQWECGKEGGACKSYPRPPRCPKPQKAVFSKKVCKWSCACPMGMAQDTQYCPLGRISSGPCSSRCRTKKDPEGTPPSNGGILPLPRNKRPGNPAPKHRPQDDPPVNPDGPLPQPKMR